MNIKLAQPLKILSMALGVVGFFIANELQRRETEEIVEKMLAKRESKQICSAPNEN